MTKKRFEETGREVGALVQEKNIAYGDSFAKSQEILEVLYPDGVKTEQYRDMLAITRVIDKLFRIATKKDAFGESPWRDICGYAILGIVGDEKESLQVKREEGHGNPYANIDKGEEEVDVFNNRDVRLSHDNRQEQEITPSTVEFKSSRLGADTGI